MRVRYQAKPFRVEIFHGKFSVLDTDRVIKYIKYILLVKSKTFNFSALRSRELVTTLICRIRRIYSQLTQKLENSLVR